jgi:hypothetical protein
VNSFLEDLWSVVVLGIEDAHEAEAGSSVELTGIEKDRWHLNLAFQVLKE